MTPVYLALGSNLDSPLQQLRQALKALQTLPQSRLVRTSGVYRSAAVGPGVQPDYLNAVVVLTTSLQPENLLDQLQQIEHNQGRVRNVRWQARTLDIDILLYGQQQISSERLSVPHPAMAQRNFVLQPLAEITGANFVLPDGTDIGTLLAACPVAELSATSFRLEDTCEH